jgi:hypothetical protein
MMDVFGIGYEWSRLSGDGDLEGPIEAFLYLTTIVFWIGVIGSLALIRRIRSLRSYAQRGWLTT